MSSPLANELCLGGSGTSVDGPDTIRPKCGSITGIGNSSDCANPVPEPELTVEVGDRPTTGHMDETVLYSVDDYCTVQPNYA